MRICSDVVLLQEVIFDIVHHLEDVLHKKSQRQISLHEEMVIRRQQEVDEQKRKDEEKRLQSEKEVSHTKIFTLGHTLLVSIHTCTPPCSVVR